eukprot:TRINITY_DN1712_c0_g1_i1.p1 TRINITY_DN1712_c0_g1~~TRINITY_DN1712_c0_g1_i1.p1  ORF type:complete len:181 (-),score=8.14 TRINITY_DN1712_c0_g1_i1:104-646(-)
MFSRLLHGPGANKGDGYFHPEHGLVDTVAHNVRGPEGASKFMQFFQAAPSTTESLPVPLTGTAAQGAQLPVLSAQDPKTLQRIRLAPETSVPEAPLVQWNPNNRVQWHSDDILRADYTKHPEWVRTMRMFHGSVWRHRTELRHPWFSRLSFATGNLLILANVVAYGELIWGKRLAEVLWQ